MIRGLLALVLLAPTASLAADSDDPALARALRVLALHPVIDGHNDLPWEIRENAKAPRDVAAYDLRGRVPGDTDLARLKAGHVGGQFWSVYTPGESKFEDYARIQLEQIDIARQLVARYPELVWALTAADMERALRAGRVGSALGLEGGHAIQNSLGALRAYYDLGVRYMTLTHNVTLDWADCASDPGKHGGLTKFGEEVVREMNRLGMLVDLSHVSPETMDDALRVSEAPVIFSHSSAKALDDVPRNVPDDILRRLGPNGGVVMITFVSGFISKEVADVYQAREGDSRPHEGSPRRGQGEGHPRAQGRAPAPARHHRPGRGSPRSRAQGRRRRPHRDRRRLRRQHRLAGRDGRRDELSPALRRAGAARMVGRGPGQAGQRKHPPRYAPSGDSGQAPTSREEAVDRHSRATRPPEDEAVGATAPRARGKGQGTRVT